MSRELLATAILRYRVKLGTADQVLRLAAAELAPALRAMSGFMTHQDILAGPQSVVFVTTYRSRPDADAGTRAANEWVERRFAAAMEGPATTTIGEVRLLLTTDGALSPADAA